MINIIPNLEAGNGTTPWWSLLGLSKLKRDIPSCESSMWNLGSKMLCMLSSQNFTWNLPLLRTSQENTQNLLRNLFSHLLGSSFRIFPKPLFEASRTLSGTVSAANLPEPCPRTYNTKAVSEPCISWDPLALWWVKTAQNPSELR